MPLLMEVRPGYANAIFALATGPYARRMLCCLGDLVEDIVVWPTATPQRGTDTASRIFRRRGGSAANVAALAAGAGGRVRFIGQVGSDPLGEMLLTEMAAAGVELAVARGGTTGTVVVLVDPDGERTMLPDRGAATQLVDAPSQALDGVGWLHVPGYSLIVEPLGETSRRLIAHARDRGAGISIDASSVGLVREYGPADFAAEVAAIAPDILFCNKDEAALLGVGPRSPHPGVATSVIKSGAAPVAIVTPTATHWIPVPPVEGVTDTTGAGDAFAAGYLLAAMQGAGPVAAAQAANRLAATVLGRPGVGFGTADRARR